ncbi:hypothetical protein [Bradyrhizobium sp. Arg816]|uniref:winged helix domain-containing protein n=1 Tax=Bradyrhizobium sp. Arg816 TaxID=2998491 RepID=UPI00249F8B60|nr:hypothetical protein [Bradyrhizobium sp. Arg816]MDI3563934.1 hypothetical protein [Bradyrhizobium sp. Arg816]
MSNITIRMPSGSQITFTGREAWTLHRLIEAGSRGVTTIDHPAPRWSHYIFKLRRAGLTITTEYEPHRDSFPGTHGRYRLETLITVVAEAA